MPLSKEIDPKETVRRLRAMAEGSRDRQPLWTIIDNYCINTMFDAARLIEELQSENQELKNKIQECETKYL